MRRIALIALVCAFIGALFVVASVSQAQSGLPGESCATYTESDIAEQTMGAGFAGARYEGGAWGHESRIDFRLNFPSSRRVSYIRQEWELADPDEYVYYPVLNASLTDQGTTFASIYAGLGDAHNTWIEGSWTGPNDTPTTTLWLYYFSASRGSTATLYIRNLYICTVPPSADTPTPTASPSPTATPDPSLQGWNKPLRGTDQLYGDTAFHRGYVLYSNLEATPYFVSSFAGAFLNIGFSEAAGQNIYAVRAGTVDSVEALTCTYTVGYGNRCAIAWDTQVALTQDYRIDPNQAYVITETLSDGWKIRYVVQRPMVVASDTVAGGCLLGTSLPVYGPASQNEARGAVIIQGLAPDATTSFDVSIYLLTEPSGVACKAQTGTSCTLLANPNFLADGAAWELDSNLTYDYIPYLVPNGGLSFPASVVQTLNLDSAKEYFISLQYQVEPGASAQRLAWALGTTQNIIIPTESPGLTTYISDPALYTADQASGLYTFRITGVEDAAQTELFLACVSEVGTYIPMPADGCIVQDPMFSASGVDSPWYDVGSSPAATIGEGMAELPDGANIKQTFLLNPKSDASEQIYDLTVTYRRKGVTAAAESIGLAWSFGVLSGTFADSDSQIWRDGVETISIDTTPSSGPLEIDAVGSDADQIVQISKICVTPQDGGTAPGYTPPLPFQGGCRFCVFSPTGDLATDFVEFQQWLACQLYQLWECQAKILLRYIWQALVSILTLFGFFRLWLSAVIQGAIGWGNGNLLAFVYWLQGQIHNAVQNVVWAILNWHGTTGGAGTNLLDVLIALINGLFSLITVFVQLVGQIIQLIIGGLIGLIANAAGLILGLLQSIINGLNASATSINADWLPNCNDANNSLFVVCTAIAGVESGLAIGPFALLLPVGIGLAALNLIFWGIKRVTAVIA